MSWNFQYCHHFKYILYKSPGVSVYLLSIAFDNLRNFKHNFLLMSFFHCHFNLNYSQILAPKICPILTKDNIIHFSLYQQAKALIEVKNKNFFFLSNNFRFVESWNSRGMTRKALISCMLCINKNNILQRVKQGSEIREVNIG